MKNDTDIAVIGSGPVGALLANLLALRGVSVTVIEKRQHPYGQARAVHFDGEAMRVFQSAGLAREILEIVIVGKGMLFKDGDGKVVVDWSRDQEIGPMGWHESYRFHQPDLDAVLLAGIDRFENVFIERGVAVTSVNQTDDCVSLTLENGNVVTANYAVGCDGAQSFLRQALGISLDDMGFNERWLVADLELTRPRPDLGDYSVQYCDPDHPATYVRSTGNHRRWEMRLGNDDPDRFAESDVWQRLKQWIGPGDARLHRAAVYTFRSCIAKKWQVQRMFLAGDAAHQMPPFMGQGLCAGIRDVANLAWKLASVVGGGNPALLETYQSEREANVREFVGLTVGLGKLINQTAAGVIPEGRMQSIWPSLGPGLGSRDTVGGALVPQIVYSDGRRSDEMAGHGFYILSRGPVHSGLPEVQGADDWLNERGLFGVIIRPDGYALCGAETADELANAARIFNALTNSLPRGQVSPF